jgi:putative pyoverdin transport system ATP-binding/permease protein
VKLLALILRRSKRWLAIATAAGLVSGASTTALIIIVNQMIQLRGRCPAWLMLGFALLCVLRLLAGLAFHGLLVRLSQNAIHDLRMDICRGILAAPLRQLETLGTARLTTAFADDMLHIATAVINLPYVFVNIIILIGCFLYLGWLSWGMVLGMGPCLIAGAVTYIVATRWANGRLRLGRQEQDRLFHHFRSLVLGAKELKLSQSRRTAFLEEALAPSAHTVRQHNTIGITLYSAAANWSRLLFFVYVGVMLLWPGKAIADVAELAGCVIVILYMMAPLEAILNALPYLAQADVALDKVQSLALSLEAEPIAVSNRPEETVIHWRELDLIDCGYVYRDQSEERNFVLGPVSLTIRPAQVTFIVGSNGSGKTTLGKLIIGLYKEDSGIITLDGKGIEMVGREAYRSMFAAVFNDFWLFDSLLGIDEEQLPLANEYLRQMKLENKIAIHEGRFSTTELSQGQRKRLALVAAILENRSIYLFDEWAADQDPEFKQYFYWHLIPQLKARGKAVIVITHDDRYFEIADQLIKLEDGKVMSGVVKHDRDEIGERIFEPPTDSQAFAPLQEGAI